MEQEIFDDLPDDPAAALRLLRGLRLVLGSRLVLRAQLRQAHSAQSGLDVLLHVVAVYPHCIRLYAAQIFSRPDVKPFTHRHALRLYIGAAIHGHSGRLHLLPHFLLRFPGDGYLHLSACAGISASCNAGLPISIGFPAARHRLFADGARTSCCFSCQNKNLLVIHFDKPTQRGV